jgi:hypothetical protein
MNMKLAMTIGRAVVRRNSGAYDISQIVQAFNTLSEGWTYQNALADRMMLAMPTIVDYDERGSYHGNVSYENGWTA